MFLQIIFPMIIGLSAIIYIVYQKDKIIKTISDNKAYSIATITDYSGKGIKRSSRSLRIVFYDQYSKIKIETFASLGTIPRNPEKQIGNKFIVIYNLYKPNDCILLTEYPLKDSTDFIKYMEKFNIEPPALERYYKSWWNKN